MEVQNVLLSRLSFGGRGFVPLTSQVFTQPLDIDAEVFQAQPFPASSCLSRHVSAFSLFENRRLPSRFLPAT